MRRNVLSYLANEFRIKKRHLQELPDTKVKCYSDKFVGKKKSFSLENDYGGKTWETKYWQFTSIRTIKKVFLVDRAQMAM